MEPVYLHNPTYIELDDAYRSLPKLEEIKLKSSNCNLSIHDLEKIGFVAIEVMSYSEEDHPDCTIRAFKGKHGPCHFTGWKAMYSGAALAALDDDNHILFTDKYKVVCEKTSNIYSLPPFENLIDRKKTSQEADLNNPIIVEESADFETDQSLLYNQLKDQKKNSERQKSLFYPGPFRFLILQDGTIVRRGKWNYIPESLCSDLIRKDGLMVLRGKPKVKTSYFQDEYAKYGSACLLDDFKPEVIDRPEFETDFSKLPFISGKFRTRLLSVINNRKKHFILIGSDANDQLGCCPSEEVTDANNLVKYGILSALAEPVQGESCPVTMYAFKGEISVNDHILSSKINQKFREEVRFHLNKSSLSKWQIMIKWLLLIFIMASLVLAGVKLYNMQNTSAERSMYEVLKPAKKNQSVVILFHNRKRCFQCMRMEKLTLEVLSESYKYGLSDESPQFKTIVIDDPANFSIVNQYGIFAATVVLVKFDQNEVVKSKVLVDATSLYRDEMAYKNFLKKELHQFLIGDNE